MGNRHVLFTMTGASSLPGGIAAVNLNILLALVDLAHQQNFPLTIYSLSERDDDRPEFLPDWVRFRGFNEGKAAMTSALLRHVFARPLYFFERVGLALAILPVVIPGLARSVLFAHGWENWRDTRTVDRWSIQKARLVITNSHFTLNKMREAMPSFRGVACPLGLSPVFKGNESPPEVSGETVHLEAVDGQSRKLGPRALLLVGRMDATERLKGHRQLIQSLPELQSRFPDAQLVFPGPGDDRPSLKQLAESEGVASSVFLPGHVPPNVLEQLYRDCYAFVMPSRQEGFGLVYLEAMNYAKPCVGCFDDGAEDVIVDGETGLLVREPNDPRELRQVLCKLLEDPERARAFGLRGFERLQSHFTAEGFRERFKTCFAPLV